ncbi:hypothetical protein [Pseudoneobacillus rhizosphaerae]|jgi:hypothetical protein|uniref:Uncharacterized protein n=1 Tax=Pseudoneobacillus rhizosphaerae TaxID=2880968 RepID=A0A9C7LBH5_9BACI|nr:hypothetical protein [Pseudoneobacillus rhizosphaerae]CAG9608550.1 hypothetical protein NEOCIP111885_02267 [Pseudoneobacillus rhizosphaerae]
MKKKTLIAILVGAFSLSVLSACNNEGDQETEEKQIQSDNMGGNNSSGGS